MPRLIWSPAALRDVQRLYRFLAPRNPAAAARAVRAIREGMQIVAAQPGVGRPADRMDPEYRE
jgi:plasmid stabilization system protein ParE